MAMHLPPKARERLRQAICEQLYFVDPVNVSGDSPAPVVPDPNDPDDPYVSHPNEGFDGPRDINVLLIGDDVKVAVKPHGTGANEHFPPLIHPYAHTQTNTEEAARRGVPQGSSASGHIMYGAVLRPLLSTLSFADRIALFGDNLAIPVKDKPEAEAVLKAITSLYATSAVGPLTIRHKINRVADGFEYCSYWTTRKSAHWGGQLHVCPSHNAYQKWEQNCIKVYHEAGGGLVGWKQVYMYTRRWMASFPLWKPHRNSRQCLWNTLQSGCWH